VFEIKTTWKHIVQDLKETYKTDMRRKEIEKRGLMVQVSSLERDKTGKSFVLEKLQSTLVKESVSLSEVKVMFAAAHCSMDGFTDIPKELSSRLKILKKTLTNDQSVRFEHDEKMILMKLK
jgi:hypothetical protein